MNLSSKRTIVWSIAGSDSGGGAGLQADLKAFEAVDVHGCTAVAAITAQNSLGVQRADAVATDLLDAQLAALAADMRPAAIKTGMLGSVSNIRCVAAWLDRLRHDGPVALVVDPVWRATTGAELSGEPLREALLHELLPRATAITPNRAEAAWLLGWSPAALATADGVARAAAALRALGPQAVVITGGDAGGRRSSDWIAHAASPRQRLRLRGDAGGRPGAGLLQRRRRGHREDGHHPGLARGRRGRARRGGRAAGARLRIAGRPAAGAASPR